ncbi:MAG: DUF3109 family protein [Anaerolineales bacterium]|jgi:hypothetical protein
MPKTLHLNPRMDDSEPLQRCNFPECRAACCVYGTWVDLAEVDDIFANKDLILPHMPSAHRQPDLWFDHQEEDDPHTPSGRVTHTMVVPDPEHYGGTACIFMRQDYECALQTAAAHAGLHPWRFKPFYCILHPLDLDELGRITLDETHLLLAEPASCLRSADKTIPLKETFSEELEYLLGRRERT